MTTMTTTTPDPLTRVDGPSADPLLVDAPDARPEPVSYASRLTPVSIRRPAPPQATSRPMPPLGIPEPAGYRYAWLAVGLAVTALFAYVVLFRFYAPADGGVDQNAYLVGGRLLAQTGSTKYVLPNAYAYTGGMFVRMPTGVYYPKYPAGLPLLYAGSFWLFDHPTWSVTLSAHAANHKWVVSSTMKALAWIFKAPLFDGTHGASYAFLVSPVSAVAAVLGTFLLARAVAGSFAGVLAAVLLGTSQVMLSLADNPNSHAACTAVIVWGMYLLVRWWQSGRVWQGVLAGLLIGYAYTIRYTEGLLVLPVAIACLTRLRWRHWTPWVLASGLGALAVAFYLFVSLWTDASADGLRGHYYWISPGRTAHTVAGVGAYLYAVAVVPAFIVTAASLTRTTRWNRFVADVGWDQWRGWAQKSAMILVALVGGWVVVNALLLAPTWAAVVDPHQWLGGLGGTLTTLAAIGLMLALLVGAWSALVAGVHRDWVKAFARSVVPGVAWAVPVALLVVYNSATMRHYAGYDTTHESEFGVAFQWKFLARNWEMVVRTFDDLELFFVVPFAIAGLALLFRRSWRVGLLLLSWLVPGVLLYTSYYWSMDFDVAYARFYMTFLPALCVAAAVAFHDGLLGGRTGGTIGPGTAVGTVWRQWGPVVQVTASVAVVAAVVLWMQGHYGGGWDTGTAAGPGWGRWSGLRQLAVEHGRAFNGTAAGLVVAAVLVTVVAAGWNGRPGRSGYAAAFARIPALLAVGLIVATSASVSTYRGLKGLRDGSQNLIPLAENYRTRLNLSLVGEHLLGRHAQLKDQAKARPAPHTADDYEMVDDVPAGSVLLTGGGSGIASPTNYIQFLRDWDVYTADTFSAEGSRRGFGGGGGGNRNRRPPAGAGNGRGGLPGFNGRGGAGGPPGGGPPGANTDNDNDQPTATPIQPEQQEYHAALYKNQTATSLAQLQSALFHRAYDSKRRVFIVIDKESLDTFSTALADDVPRYTRSSKNPRGDHYTLKTIDAWTDVATPVARDDENATPDDRANRWGGGGNNRFRRGGGGGAGGGMARLFGLTDVQNDWVLAEILPATPDAKPAARRPLARDDSDDEDDNAGRRGGWGGGFGGGGGGNGGGGPFNGRGRR